MGAVKNHYHDELERHRAADDGEVCPTCEGHGRLICTIGNSTLCPYDDTIPCPDCQEQRA